MKKKIFFMLLHGLLFSNIMLSAQNWIIGGNSLPAAGGQIGSTNNRAIIFKTNNIERGRITPAGLWGIGTTNPNVKLHIVGGAPAFANSGGYIVTGPISGRNVAIDDNSVNARNNGSWATLYLNSANTYINDEGGGNVLIGAHSSLTRVGIGTEIPNHTLHVVYSAGNANVNGIMNENASSPGLWWNMYVSGGGDLWLFNDNRVTPVGVFDDVSGAYSAPSDKRFKKDITSIDKVLEKVMKLKPSSYHFTSQKQMNDRKFIGMIAQEVQDVFPEIVYEHTGKNDGVEDFLTLDYSTVGVIAIKAIQEQQQKINDQDKKIEELTKLVNELKQGQQTNNNSIIKSTISDASLEQNMPNPFSKTTTIAYNLPQKFTNAQIVITDKNGKMLKQVSVSGSGKGAVNIEAAAFSAGTYNYSLIVAGKIISAKQMVLTK